MKGPLARTVKMLMEVTKPASSPRRATLFDHISGSTPRRCDILTMTRTGRPSGVRSHLDYDPDWTA